MTIAVSVASAVMSDIEHVNQCGMRGNLRVATKGSTPTCTTTELRLDLLVSVDSCGGVRDTYVGGEDASIDDVNVNTCTSAGVIGIREGQSAAVLVAKPGG